MTIVTNQGNVFLIYKTKIFSYSADCKPIFNNYVNKYHGKELIEKILKDSYYIGVRRK